MKQEREHNLNKIFESDKNRRSVLTTTDKFRRSHTSSKAAIEVETLQETHQLKVSIPKQVVKMNNQGTSSNTRLHQKPRFYDIYLKICLKATVLFMIKEKPNDARVRDELCVANKTGAGSVSILK